MEEPVHIREVALGGEGDDQTSLLDALAAQRDEIATTKSVEIPLSAYGKSGIPLFVKYRLLTGEELNTIARRINQEFDKTKQWERALYTTIDTMIAACEGFLVQIGDKREVLIDRNGVSIEGFGQQLAEALKFADKTDGTARSCVLAFFGNNTIALQSHSVQLARWMGDTTTDVTQDFLSEMGNL